MANDLFSFSEAQKRDLIRYIEEQIAAVVAESAATTVTANNLNTWAFALATKLNADAGVTDVNYDTDPQA
jgi:predicted carbohydrate-binding protein with CBM5 and CBM33 domain